MMETKILATEDTEITEKITVALGERYTTAKALFVFSVASVAN